MRSPFLLCRDWFPKTKLTRGAFQTHTLWFDWMKAFLDDHNVVCVVWKEVEKGSCWETQRRNRIMRSRLLLLGRVLQFLTKFRLIFPQNKVHSPTNHVIYKPRENHTKKFFATGLNVVVLAFVCRCCCWQGDIYCGASSQTDFTLVVGNMMMMFHVEYFRTKHREVCVSWFCRFI